jgi:ABC-type nitrate/sulfonate/bicarbonate transport system substrate-binding protein
MFCKRGDDVMKTLGRYGPHAAVVLLAGMLIGLDGSSAAAQSSSLAGVDFLQAYVPSSEYVYFVVADKKGYYKDAGIRFVQHAGSGSANTVKLVGAGRFPVGLADAGIILAGKQTGEPIEAVMGFYNTTPTAVISLKSANITSLNDLVGKTLASEAAGSTTPMWRAAMVAAHVPVDKVHWVAINSAAKVPALLTGKVDAILGQLQPISIEDQGKHVNIVPIGDVIHVIADCVLVNTNWLSKPGNDRVLRGFIAASLKGMEYTKNHISEAVDLTNAEYPTLTKDVLKKQLVMEHRWIWTPAAIKNGVGKMDVQQWQNLEKIMLEAKILQGPVDVHTAFTNAYLPTKLPH